MWACGQVLPASGHREHNCVLSPLPMAEEHARAKVHGDEESFAEQNILGVDRGTKRAHTLNTNTCAEESPPKKINKGDDAINKEVPTIVKEEDAAAALEDELEAQLHPSISSNSSETSILSTMTRPVARFISGVTLDTDLSPDATVPDGMPIQIAEARQRIARTCGVANGRIRLIDPIGRGLLEDHALLGVEVVVIVLSLDPEAERAAEASLLRACNAEDMNSLHPLRKLDISQSNLANVPESFSQLTALQTLDMFEKKTTQ